MMKKTSIYLTVALLLMFSCKNKKCENVPDLPKEYTDYWLFEEGSWWVYQLESDSTVYDTATLSEVKESVSTYNEVNNGNAHIACRKEYKYTIKHSNDMFELVKIPLVVGVIY